MSDVSYFSERYEVKPADPAGYWLIPQKSSDPNEWALMELPNPVDVITRQQIELEAWRSGRLWRYHQQLRQGESALMFHINGSIHNTIEAAVDALEAEEKAMAAHAAEDSGRL